MAHRTQSLCSMVEPSQHLLLSNDTRFGLPADQDPFLAGLTCSLPHQAGPSQPERWVDSPQARSEQAPSCTWSGGPIPECEEPGPVRLADDQLSLPASSTTTPPVEYPQTASQSPCCQTPQLSPSARTPQTSDEGAASPRPVPDIPWTRLAALSQPAGSPSCSLQAAEPPHLRSPSQPVASRGTEPPRHASTPSQAAAADGDQILLCALSQPGLFGDHAAAQDVRSPRQLSPQLPALSQAVAGVLQAQAPSGQGRDAADLRASADALNISYTSIWRSAAAADVGGGMDPPQSAVRQLEQAPMAPVQPSSTPFVT